MALVLANFKEISGRQNFSDGGQVYSVFSTTDTLAVMMASGYLDNLSTTLNVRDSIVMSGKLL